MATLLASPPSSALRSPKIWGLSLVWHLLLIFWIWILIRWLPLFRLPLPDVPTRVDFGTVNQDQLEKLRQKWKSEDRGTIVSPSRTKPLPETEAPRDTPYLSDRDRAVEKEQRAREQGGAPRLGAPDPGQARKDTSKDARKTPDLSKLGVQLPTPAEKQVDARSRESRGGERVSSRTGDEMLEDQSLPQGSQNILNTRESVFYSYFSRLDQAVSPLWESIIRSAQPLNRVGPGDYVTEVEIVFDAQGELVEVNELKSSGVPEWDNAVKSVFRRIRRFPNPPKSLIDGDGHVRIPGRFLVRVRDGALQWNFAPPEP